MKKLSAQLCMVTALLFVAVVYFLQLPSTVQFGDTGELVAAAKNLFVPHPPGYPVFIWLQALFVNLVPWGSVFWRASFLSAVFSIAGLAFFAKASKEVNLVTVGAILLVAFSRIFWRYSELPDVFSLNTLFAAVILYLYFQNDGKKRMRLLPFVFCVGLANHHTLIFLAPLVLCVMWTHRHEKVFYFSAGLGAIAFVGLYASLQLLNPESFYSWGKVTSASEVVRHFFRADYGTFRLMGSDQSFSIFRNYKDVFTKTLLFLYPLFVLAVVACSGILGARPRLQRKDFFVLGSALLYGGVFFSLANTASTGFLLEVLDRFLILFQFLIAFVLLRVIQSSQASNLIKKIMGVFLIAAACLHLFWWHKENDFSKNTIVEDYAINLLNEAPADKRTVALISSDTRAFATRYVQSVLNVRPDVKVISPKGLFFPWYSDKAIRETGLLLNAKAIADTNKLDLQSDVILPNISKFNFITPLVFVDSNDYQISILPLGRMLSQGSGVALRQDYYLRLQFRSAVQVVATPLTEYDIFRDLWSDYAFFPLIQGKEFARLGQVEQAQTVFKKALENTPWCFPIAEELCKIEKSSDPNQKLDCDEEMQLLQKTYFRYFE